MINILLFILRLYELVLLGRIITSWIHLDPANPIVDWLHRLTEPVLGPVRRLLPIRAMGIDFSPIIVFVLLSLIRRLLMQQVVF